ncbi:carboxypeptidase-like regulatory domain-containing protein [Litchfieldella rifensis]|uniref:Carboxypeptidase-like regulatory domain-containing protein n=1 Tax=Litchfieldella rifensis TaxID=762643 RepID=A0ABV7LRU5_9GAMM
MHKWLALMVIGVMVAGCQVMGPGVDSTSRRIEIIDRNTERAAGPGTRPSPPAGRVARQVPFPEQEYAALSKHGNATISGRLYFTTRSGDRIYGANETISVAPVTTYSAEAAEVALAGRAVEPADPRAQAFTRQARTDSQGHFTVNGLPAGDYYVAGSVSLPGTSQRSPIIIHQVHVGTGQTARVTLSR